VQPLGVNNGHAVPRNLGSMLSVFREKRVAYISKTASHVFFIPHTAISVMVQNSNVPATTRWCSTPRRPKKPVACLHAGSIIWAKEDRVHNSKSLWLPYGGTPVSTQRSLRSPLFMETKSSGKSHSLFLIKQEYIGSSRRHKNNKMQSLIGECLFIFTWMKNKSFSKAMVKTVEWSSYFNSHKFQGMSSIIAKSLVHQRLTNTKKRK